MFKLVFFALVMFSFDL